MPEKVNTSKYKAEVWDQMHMFFDPFHDHQIHGVIYFDDIIDLNILKKAVLMTIEAVPVIACRYVENTFLKPHWESINIDIDKMVVLIKTDQPEKQINNFITGKTDEKRGPLMKIAVVRSDGRDTFCIVMSHTVADGTSFKDYLYMLASVYSGLTLNPQYKLEHKKTDIRGMNQLFEQFSFFEKIRIAFMPNNMKKHNSGIKFPFTGKGNKPYIIRYCIDKSRFDYIKAYGKKYDATVNDVLLTAYHRALRNYLQLNDNQSLPIPCMLNLRKYMPDQKTKSICNLTSILVSDIGSDIGNTFEETLKKVKADMDDKKNSNGCLNGPFLLNLSVNALPYWFLKWKMKDVFVNPLIGMTNIGIIDKNRLAFGGLNINDAFLTASKKYYPYFQLALSTYDNNITFTINFYGCDDDKKTVEEFYEYLDFELPKTKII